jgi:DNA/RNA-binding domain of Phe-tRNA-synthetase-like protein
MTQFEFRADGTAKVKLAGLQIGYACFSGVTNSKASQALDEEINSTCKAVADKFADLDRISEDETVKGVRTMFSKAGLDPTKERPSGEALIRRVASGKGIYRVNPVVDINNIVSLETGCPCGVYDAEKIEGNTITVLVGAPGGTYQGIAGKTLNTENRILTADAQSIFGGPTADSGRTCVRPESKEILMLIYAPQNVGSFSMDDAISRAASLMNKVTNGTLAYSGKFTIR